MTAWLLAWMWQGLALALGVTVAVRYVRGLNASTRHLIWFGALIALGWLGWAGSPHAGSAAPQLSIGDTAPIYIPSAPDILISGVIGIWAACTLIALLRLLPSLHAVYALRDRCRPFPQVLETTLPLWLEHKGHGRRTELMMCDAVPGATVLGLQRPCIAIPSSLAEVLTADELDQVILHEYAHVQRRDDWSRLTQALLMSVLWIHPAALLVSRALNREREMACDEWVVARTGLPKVYARCLTRAAEVRIGIDRGSILIPTLLDGRHDLVRRVDRLLTIKGKTRRNVSYAPAAAALFAMAMISTHLQEIRFAEIADIVLPSVARPVLIAQNQPSPPAPAHTANAPVALVSAPRAIPASVATVVIPNAPSPDAPDAANAPNAPNALISVDAPSLGSLTSVAFAGVYQAPNAPATRPIDQSNPWSVLGAPSVEIASAAKKTSIGIAGAFSRAGVSLARSF